tara:strand:- start:12145 stop:12882 length:738 start_codon:yes stop_codon:yes gene_type:complete
MRSYKVNKIDHVVFDSKDEVPEDIHYLRDWREGHIGDWVKADDDCIIQILRKGSMLKVKGKNRQVRYIGTCTGTFIVSDKTLMDTSRRVNIYSFGGDIHVDDIVEARKDLNSREELFLHYWMDKRMTPQQAYLEAFPTNNPSYANVKAGKLIKTERITTRMNEKLRPVLEELNISDKLVLENIKALATDGSKEETRLKALFKLSDILDLEDKTKTSVQQISGAVFQGFSNDQLEEVKRKEITDGE